MRLPLAQLELTRRAKRKSVYWMRLLVPLCAASILFMFWIYSLVGDGNLTNAANFSSGFLSRIVFVFQLLVVFVYAPLLASNAFARDKSDLTFELLILTGARESDIILSKGIWVFLESELLILSCLPLQAIASNLGGLTLDMYLAQQVLLAASCFMMVWLGLLCSALASSATDALGYAIVGGLFWLIGAAALDSWLLAPYGLGRSNVIGVLLLTYRPGYSFLNVAICAAYSLSFGCTLFWACRAAIRVVPKRRVPKRGGYRKNLASYRGFDRIPGLRLSAIGRLYAANAAGEGATIYRWPWCVLFLLLMIPYGIFGFFVFWVIAISMAVKDASSSLTSACAEGGLEPIFLTSASDDEIATEIYRTHLRRSMLFFLPLLLANLTWMGVSTYFSKSLLIQSIPPVLRYAGVGGLALISSFIEISAIVSLACASITFFRSVNLRPLAAMAWFLGIYCIAGCLGAGLNALPAASKYFSPESFSIWTMPGQIVPRVLYLGILLYLSGEWRAEMAKEVGRWRYGESIFEGYAYRVPAKEPT